ncbi:DUF2254 domain-containing protein [Desertimonas flava]|uniref:DUF2254 domain-containing protein n=1 Tax=Desertimonas flava TaxID=2064846 RepID=UPI000E3555C4|nr:DUF2254 domain-containing protein [Desertimonas flava]
MKVRLSSIVERLRSSLFFVPMSAVVAAAVLGLGLLAVDRRVDITLAELPFGFTSTVESARTLLGAIAAATISFAGIAFSVSLLILQLASSQYSPRVVHALFRDPFNKRVMALVVGTFTYCIVVLRSVRSALEADGEPVIPNVSVAVAVVLGIVAILAIVAFIDHNAHTMDVSEILERIRRETVTQIHASWEPAEPGHLTGPLPPKSSQPTTVVRSDGSGWIQLIDTDTIIDLVPDGATVRVHTEAGQYAIAHSPLMSITPPSDDELIGKLRSAVVIGHTRTMQQDVTYGLRQTVDIALRALSPGINDPTTAQDAIFHTAAILSELLRREPPPAVTTNGDRTVVMERRPSHDALIGLAFDEIRRAGSADPAVCCYLLDTLASLIESVTADGYHDRTTELRRQAHLVLEASTRHEQLDDDIAAIRSAYAQIRETT